MAEKPLPKFDTGPVGTGDLDTDTSVYKIDVGFGLVDEKGNPLALPPIQIGTTISALAGTNPKAYARIKAAVAALTGRKSLDPNYVGGYVSRLAQNIMGSSDIIAKTGTIEDYFKKAITTSGGTTDGLPKPYTQITEIDPARARGLVESAFEKELRRKPTAEELKLYTDKLVEAEKKNPVKYTYTKDKAGNTVATQTTGLDEGQFLAEQIRGTKEYADVKQSGIEAAMQKVRNSAMANGYPITEGDAARFAEQITNGVSPDEIASTFRKIAAISQPKNIADLLNAGVDLSTIYQPYRNVMASTLEINPNGIKLDDPALSKAIQGDKALTTYEFQRELRKDPRWQYTDNARSETASVVTKVLKDFGFMG